MKITVFDNQVEKAIKGLKRRLSKEGMFRELKKRRYYIKPSVKKKLKIKEAMKKRKAARKRVRDIWSRN